MVWILSVLIVSSGVVYGWWPQIEEWFQGGEASIPVNRENRGKGRHSSTYFASPLRLERLHDNTWRLRTLTGMTVVWET
jgi:hypothetical protein